MPAPAEQVDAELHPPADHGASHDVPGAMPSHAPRGVLVDGAVAFAVCWSCATERAFADGPFAACAPVSIA